MLGDALGVSQHHDAVTGTAKQHTTNDYAKRLAIGESAAEATSNSAISCFVSKSRNQCTSPPLTFSQCQLLNISYCPPTEEAGAGKSLVIVAYNPLGWNRTDIIRIPVNDANLIVSDSSGKTIDSQYVIMDNVTSNLRQFSLKAYLGLSSNDVPKYWLVFQVSVAPLGWTTYFITHASVPGKKRHRLSVTGSSQNETIIVGPGNFKMSFSSTTGQMKRINNSNGVDMPIQQSYLWYGSSSDDQVPLKVYRGPLMDEVHQQFNSWIYQVIRLYKNKEHAEIEFTIGPIPTEDNIGKEVITRITTNMVTDKVYYTDSNGRDFLKRFRDYRADWNLSVNQPEAGNYYPINLGIFISDKKFELSVLVDRATGGASIHDGEVELMLHRRIISDDTKGVVGSLNETVCVEDKCKGLTVRGNYYLSVSKLGDGSVWRRTTGQEVYSLLLLAFTHEEEEESWKANHLSEGSVMDPSYSLPMNVVLITLQELDDGSVLLRLAHLYERGEDPTYSAMAKVELKKMFSGKEIKEVKEMSLSANQYKSEMKKMKWKVENSGDDEPLSSTRRGGPVHISTLVVELAPMEIRTFLLTF